MLATHSYPTRIPYERHAGFFVEFTGSLSHGSIATAMEYIKGPNNFTKEGGNMKTNKSLGSTLAAGAVAMSLLLGADAVQAAVITFGNPPVNTDIDPGEVYSEAGFNFEVISGNNWSIEANFGAGISGASLSTGPVVVARPDIGDTIKITHEDGLLFDFTSFESARRGGDPSDRVDFLGFVGATQTESILDFSEGATTFFSTDVSWDLVDEIRIVVDQAGNSGLNLDNLELTAVPVPAAAWLFGSGLVALSAVARRRKQTA